jgi:hypothetical protein
VAGAAQPTTEAAPLDATGALRGCRELKVASFVGLVGQLLVWATALVLWVVGSFFADIPTRAQLVYGASGVSIAASTLFALNDLLIVGLGLALISLVLSYRGLGRAGGAVPRLEVGAARSLALVGAIGFGMVALGWAIWLGSFVAPGSVAGADPSAYAPVLGSNLGVAVDLLVGFGSLLAFLGMIGLALAGSKVAETYDEGLIELGGALLLVPVLSIIGYSLSWLGFARGQRKLEHGWSPRPIPRTPVPPIFVYPSPGYPSGPAYVVPAAPQSSSWDGLAAVLVVIVILLWVFIVPFSLVIATGGLVHGPGTVPGGGGGPGGPTNGPSAAASPTPLLPVLLVALLVTGILLPLAVARNRRKRQRSGTVNAALPPPPPPPPQPPPRDTDPLDHLV